jgi:hypothetical protein
LICINGGREIEQKVREMPHFIDHGMVTPEILIRFWKGSKNSSKKGEFDFGVER